MQGQKCYDRLKQESDQDDKRIEDGRRAEQAPRERKAAERRVEEEWRRLRKKDAKRLRKETL